MVMTVRPNSKDVNKDENRSRPAVHVTSRNYLRLTNVMWSQNCGLRGYAPLVDLLAEEFDRAEIVEPAAMP